jgi:hypothetical protein
MYIRSFSIPVKFYDKYVKNDPILTDKNISIFSDCIPTLDELAINEVNILIIQEPNEYFGLHDWAVKNNQYFSCILTWSEEILNKCENAMLLPFGTTFLHSKDKYKELSTMDKNLEISYICGPKKLIDGHFLRHKIYEMGSEIKMEKKWIYSCPMEEKYKCFESSMFHLCIENSARKDYFTEKIVDAFITRTIPIYWGCTNITDYFDPRGFFIINSEEEFLSLINSLTEDDYNSRLEYVEKNYEIGIYYAHYFNRVNDVLKQIITLNNI